MTTDEKGPPTGPESSARPTGLIVLIGVLALETIGVAALTAWLVIELFTTRAASIGGGIAIVVLAIIALAWAAATTLGAVRRRNWMRGSALTMQLVQMAVALGAFQGQYAVPDIGWVLLVPAVLATAMILLPSVVAATRPGTGTG